MSDAAQTVTDTIPDERHRAASAGTIVVLVALAIATVAGANYAAAVVLGRMPINRGYALARGKWTLMERTLAEKRPVDVLIVGDSSSNQGLNPGVIEALTGRSALNLGVVADALTIQPVWQISRFMDQTKRDGGRFPRTVLWMHVYDIWSRQDRGSRRLRAISANLPPAAWPHINAGPKVNVSPGRLKMIRALPLYFQNASLGMLIRTPRAAYAESHRFVFDERGFTTETTPDPSLVRRDIRNHMNLARSTESFEPTKLSRQSIDAMARLAERYKFDLWIVEGPTNRTLWTDDVFRRRWFEVHGAIKSAAGRHPHVKVMFDEPMLFDEGQMQNCDHLLLDAANEFTAEVVKRMRQSPASAPATAATTSPAR